MSKVLARINKELKSLTEDDPIEGVMIAPQYLDDQIMWEVTVVGPSETPYEGGFFRLAFNFNEDYPTVPPYVNFLTPIYHMNVSSESGEICQAAFSNDWEPSKTTREIILAIISLMQAPLEDDPIENGIAEHYFNDFEGFFEQARTMTFEYAQPLEYPEAPMED